LPESPRTLVLSQIEVMFASGQSQRYFLPLAVTGAPEVIGASGGAISYMLAQVRRGARLEGIYDAAAERGFVRSPLRAVARGDRIGCESQTIQCESQPGPAALTFPPDVEVRRLGADQSNSSILIGEQVVLKIYRRLVPGIHPEIEFGKFLTQVGYANTP